RKTHRLGDDSWSISKAVLQIDADRQIGCSSDGGGVLEHRIATDGIVRLSDGESVARATRGQRFEAQLCQKPCAADIPRVGNDECPGALMKFSKSSALFSLS